MTEYENSTATQSTAPEDTSLVLYPTVEIQQPSKAATIFSIIAFVCGILSLCTLWYGLDFAIAGLIFAMLSKKRTGGIPLSKAKQGKTMSIIGLIVSSIWMIAYLVYYIHQLNELLPSLISSLT